MVCSQGQLRSLIDVTDKAEIQQRRSSVVRPPPDPRFSAHLMTLSMLGGGKLREPLLTKFAHGETEASMYLSCSGVWTATPFDNLLEATLPPAVHAEEHHFIQ